MAKFRSILTIRSYYVTYAFKSDSTLYSCRNVKELLARSRRKISSLSDCRWTRTYNHLVHKWTLNHLAKLFYLVVFPNWRDYIVLCWLPTWYIYFFNFLCSNFLLFGNIELLQKLDIFLSFEKVQIWLTQYRMVKQTSQHRT